MSTAGFASTIKLGKVGAEISVTTTVFPLDDVVNIAIGNKKADFEAWNGVKKRAVFRKLTKGFGLSATQITRADAEALESLKLLDGEALSFIYADDWKMNSDPHTLLTTLTFRLSDTSHRRLDEAYQAISGAAQIAVVGAFTTYSASGAQTGTNYYTGGSYNRTTGIVTLNSSPGAAGTKVYVNWTYKGALVFLEDLAMSRKGFDASGYPAWTAQIKLVGV